VAMSRGCWRRGQGYLNHSDRSVGSIYGRFECLDQDRSIMAAIARHVLRVVGDGEADKFVVRLR
jgi:hypothetical protein